MWGVVESLRAARRPLAAAVLLAAIEALVLLGLAVFLVVKAVVDEAKSLFGVVGGAGLAVLGAAVLLGVAPWLLAGARWARSPVVVLQILWLPVGFSLAFQAGRPEIGAPLLAVALVELALLARAEAGLGPADDDGAAESAPGSAERSVGPVERSVPGGEAGR